MSERRAFQCPNCGDAIGALIDATAIRCDYKVTGWRSVQTGVNRKKEPTYEHVVITVPGCGGLIKNCCHGSKTCPSCPVFFENAAEPPEPLRPLADIMRDETEARNMRERAAKDAEHSYVPRRLPPMAPQATGSAPPHVPRQAPKVQPQTPKKGKGR